MATCQVASQIGGIPSLCEHDLSAQAANGLVCFQGLTLFVRLQAEVHPHDGLAPGFGDEIHVSVAPLPPSCCQSYGR